MNIFVQTLKIPTIISLKKINNLKKKYTRSYDADT